MAVYTQLTCQIDARMTATSGAAACTLYTSLRQSAVDRDEIHASSVHKLATIPDTLSN